MTLNGNVGVGMVNVITKSMGGNERWRDSDWLRGYNALHDINNQKWHNMHCGENFDDCILLGSMYHK